MMLILPGTTMGRTSIIPVLFTAVLALAACIPLTHCSDDGPVAPPDTTKPPPPRDTTSHEFTWELHKIGDEYGEMEDIWAIDDDYAIAVGRFTWQDSTGTEISSRLTDVVELRNGNLSLLKAYSPEGIRIYTPTSCFGTSENNLWIGSGVPLKRSGSDTGYIAFVPTDVQRPPWGGLVNKMWGNKNSEDVYLTCGPVIQRVTDGRIKTVVVPYGSPGMGFYDIWGEENGDVMVVGNNGSDGYFYLYHIKPDDTWEIVHKTKSSIGGVWAFNDIWYFTEYSTLKTWDGASIKTWMPKISNPHEIRGNHENDIFLCYGSGGKVLHWNGSTLQYIYDGELGDIFTMAMSVTENAVYVCGYAAAQ